MIFLYSIIVLFSFLPMQTILAMDDIKEAIQQEQSEQTILIPIQEPNQIKNNKINLLRLTGKTIAGLSIGLIAHCGLEFISTSMHEMGHNVFGVLMGAGWSPMNITFTKNPLMPWAGNTDIHNLKHGQLLVDIAGPAIGILITYVQLLLLEKLDRCAKKPRKSKRCRSCCFFPRFTNIAKKVWTRIFSKKVDKDTEEPSFATVTINSTKWYRWSRIIGGSIYGFTPIDLPELNGKAGDGLQAWRDLLDKNIKGYKANLPLLVATPMLVPIVVGLGKALCMK